MVSALNTENPAHTQDARMSTLVHSQRLAAIAFQSAFETQVASLADLFEGIEKQVEATRDDKEANHLISATYERALAEFQALTETATRANIEAFCKMRDAITDNAGQLHTKPTKAP